MKLTNSKIFIISCLAFIVGIVLASFLPNKYLRFDLGIFILVIIFLILSIVFWSDKKFRLINLIGLFLFLGIWRFSISLPLDSPDKIWHYNGQKIELVGVVDSDPIRKVKSQQVIVKILNISANNEKLKMSEIDFNTPRLARGEPPLLIEGILPEKISVHIFIKNLKN